MQPAQSASHPTKGSNTQAPVALPLKSIGAKTMDRTFTEQFKQAQTPRVEKIASDSSIAGNQGTPPTLFRPGSTGSNQGQKSPALPLRTIGPKTLDRMASADLTRATNAPRLPRVTSNPSLTGDQPKSDTPPSLLSPMNSSSVESSLNANAAPKTKGLTRTRSASDVTQKPGAMTLKKLEDAQLYNAIQSANDFWTGTPNSERSRSPISADEIRAVPEDQIKQYVDQRRKSPRPVRVTSDPGLNSPANSNGSQETRKPSLSVLISPTSSVERGPGGIPKSPLLRTRSLSSESPGSSPLSSPNPGADERRKKFLAAQARKNKGHKPGPDKSPRNAEAPKTPSANQPAVPSSHHVTKEPVNLDTAHKDMLKSVLAQNEKNTPKSPTSPNSPASNSSQSPQSSPPTDDNHLTPTYKPKIPSSRKADRDKRKSEKAASTASKVQKANEQLDKSPRVPLMSPKSSGSRVQFFDQSQAQELSSPTSPQLRGKSLLKKRLTPRPLTVQTSGLEKPVVPRLRIQSLVDSGNSQASQSNPSSEANSPKTPESPLMSKHQVEQLFKKKEKMIRLPERTLDGAVDHLIEDALVGAFAELSIEEPVLPSSMKHFFAKLGLFLIDHRQSQTSFGFSISLYDAEIAAEPYFAEFSLGKKEIQRQFIHYLNTGFKDFPPETLKDMKIRFINNLE